MREWLTFWRKGKQVPGSANTRRELISTSPRPSHPEPALQGLALLLSLSVAGLLDHLLPSSPPPLAGLISARHTGRRTHLFRMKECVPRVTALLCILRSMEGVELHVSHARIHSCAIFVTTAWMASSFLHEFPNPTTRQHLINSPGAPWGSPVPDTLESTFLTNNLFRHRLLR